MTEPHHRGADARNPRHSRPARGSGGDDLRDRFEKALLEGEDAALTTGDGRFGSWWKTQQIAHAGLRSVYCLENCHSLEEVAYDVSVNVVLLGGADFDSPPPLGTTERSRYVKLKTLEEAQGPEMNKWIEQAERVPGWK